ncbi:MAG: hypothetical protein COA43_09675 [Robiginitomaculum sp.]|nr:MAG: hypothetical protein COA43_09675 [Robiginitomaculum sp.]
MRSRASGLEQKKNLIAWQLYLKNLRAKGETIPSDAVPARAENLVGLPPTIGYVGDQDLFCDENIAFFKRLEASNVPTEFKVIKGAYHAVETIAPKSKVGRESWEFILNAFAYAVDNYTKKQP